MAGKVEAGPRFVWIASQAVMLLIDWRMGAQNRHVFNERRAK